MSDGARSGAEISVLTDTWHPLGIGETQLTEVLGRRAQAIADRGPAFRAALLWYYGRRFQLVVSKGTGRYAKMAAALHSLGRGRRKVVFLEFIQRSRRRWGASVIEGASSFFFRRSALGVQVMTAWERDDLISRRRVSPGRTRHIEMAKVMYRDQLRSPEQAGRSGVFASGKAACDWPLLFHAASHRGWSLTVACTKRDAAEVNSLAGNLPSARVHVDVPRSEHAELIAGAAVYAIPLEEQGLSSGQLRLMEATTFGTPVVATNVSGLDGYLRDGETCRATKPGDPKAFGDAVDSLVSDTGLAESLATRAQAEGQSWSRVEYCAELGRFVQQCAKHGS